MEIAFKPNGRIWGVASKKHYKDSKFYTIIVHKLFQTPEEAKAESEAMNKEGKETFWGEIVEK